MADPGVDMEFSRHTDFSKSKIHTGDSFGDVRSIIIATDQESGWRVFSRDN